MLRIGVISAYPDEDWDARQIARAASREDRVDVLAPTEFHAEVRPGAVRVWARGRDVREYHVMLTPRTLGDAGDPDVQLELYRTLRAQGVPLVNDVDALLFAVDKFRCSVAFAAAGLPTPAVRLVQTVAQAERALDALGDALIKPVFGSLGRGIERLRAGERDGGRLARLLQRYGALYLQAFVTDVERDVRAFVIGARVEAAARRRPEPGDFRGNASCGAAFEPIELDPATAGLAVRASQLCGLDYAGVDLLVTAAGPLVIEVNGTPSFRALGEATGRDVGAAIVAHATQRRRAPAIERAS